LGWSRSRSCRTPLAGARITLKFGTLEIGKVADMTMMAEDPLTCHLDLLKDIRIERTFLGRRQVFGPT